MYGGVGMGPQEHAFRSGVDIIVATPGRLLDHCRMPYAKLDALEFLVFDVELLVLYPWAVAANDAHPLGQNHEVFWVVMAFLTILMVGFVYTWRKGVFKCN